MAKYLCRYPRRRIGFFVIPSLIISFIFIVYQVSIFYQFISGDAGAGKPFSGMSRIRGTHPQEEHFYVPRYGKFVCIKSMEILEFNKVNDDYCDCLDGTDEPGTNACPNGVFYCSTTTEHRKFPKLVPSAKVNDGICDCCDGSDEYKNLQLLNVDRQMQEKTGHYLVPCPNACGTYL
ncbi:glucosidase 2 subunit beta [Cylas formicarius]|uniref:glucosidase 2 subunit beta n=1 Tax=Cylas formicarius TaxID=197179 RepID=UPI002958D761|nr:glucosidase 2 subunit beta [Cylas formicarius]